MSRTFRNQAAFLAWLGSQLPPELGATPTRHVIDVDEEHELLAEVRELDFLTED